MLVRQLSPQIKGKRVPSTPTVQKFTLPLETLKVIDGKIATIMRKQYPIKEFIPKREQIRKRLMESKTWSS